MKLNQSLAAPLLPKWAHPTWAGEPQGILAGSAGPCYCGGEARAPGRAPLAEGRRQPGLGARPRRSLASFRTRRLLLAHRGVSVARPRSCLTSDQTPFCDRFLDSPANPPPFRSLLQEFATSSGYKPFPDKRQTARKELHNSVWPNRQEKNWGTVCCHFSMCSPVEQGEGCSRSRVWRPHLLPVSTRFSVRRAPAAEGPEPRAQENKPMLLGFSLEGGPPPKKKPHRRKRRLSGYV